MLTNAGIIPNRLKSCGALPQRGRHYTIGPGKSYFVEALGEAIKYTMAKRNPEKFMSRIMSQKLKKAKVVDHSNGKTSVKVTKDRRRVGRVLMMVLQKFVEIFREVFRREEVEAAFNSNDVKVVVEQYMLQKLI